MSHLAFVQQMHAALTNAGYAADQWEIRSLPLVSSTNTRVDDMLGLYDRAIVLAKSQSKGKGRQNRAWYSPVGGLWLSLGFLTDGAAEELSTPIIEEIHAILSQFVDCEIKEPNDILINGKKVCGLLVESKIRKNKLERVIIGIGINIRNELPDEVKDIATRLVDHDADPEIFDLATELVISIINRLRYLIPKDQ